MLNFNYYYHDKSSYQSIEKSYDNIRYPYINKIKLYINTKKQEILLPGGQLEAYDIESDKQCIILINMVNSQLQTSRDSACMLQPSSYNKIYGVYLNKRYKYMDVSTQIATNTDMNFNDSYIQLISKDIFAEWAIRAHILANINNMIIGLSIVDTILITGRYDRKSHDFHIITSISSAYMAKMFFKTEYFHIVHWIHSIISLGIMVQINIHLNITSQLKLLLFKKLLIIFNYASNSISMTIGFSPQEKVVNSINI